MFLEPLLKTGFMANAYLVLLGVCICLIHVLYGLREYAILSLKLKIPSTGPEL